MNYLAIAKTFAFRTQTVDAVNEAGEKIKVKTKRDAVVFDNFPALDQEGILTILTEGSDTEKALLIDVVNSVFEDRTRQILSDKEDIKSSADFPMDQLTWQAIANLPKTDRRSTAIDKEVWDAFLEHYLAVMPAITGKEVVKIQNHVDHFKAKLNKIKGKKVIAKVLQQSLTQYLSSEVAGVEDYVDCIAWLNTRLVAILNEDEASEADAL